MTGRLPWLCLVAAGSLAACSSEPVSVERAMSACMEPARKASAPATTIGLGLDSEHGVRTSFSIEFTDDYLAGRDPDEVFEACVIQQSGVRPDRSYSEIVDDR